MFIIIYFFFFQTFPSARYTYIIIVVAAESFIIVSPRHESLAAAASLVCCSSRLPYIIPIIILHYTLSVSPGREHAHFSPITRSRSPLAGRFINNKKNRRGGGGNPILIDNPVVRIYAAAFAHYIIIVCAPISHKRALRYISTDIIIIYITRWRRCERVTRPRADLYLRRRGQTSVITCRRRRPYTLEL